MAGSPNITATVVGTITTITIITKDLTMTATGILPVGIQVGTTAEAIPVVDMTAAEDIPAAAMTAAEAEEAAEMVEEVVAN